MAAPVKLLTLAALACTSEANQLFHHHTRSDGENPDAEMEKPLSCDRNRFEKQFYHLAKKFTPVTDKVTTHQYEVMYGIFLVPLTSSRPSKRRAGHCLGQTPRGGGGTSLRGEAQALSPGGATQKKGFLSARVAFDGSAPEGSSSRKATQTSVPFTLTEGA